MNNGKRTRNRKRRSRKGKGRLIILFLILIALIAGGVSFVMSYQDKRDYSALNSQDKKNKQVKIKDGENSEEIANKLDKAGLIRSKKAFMHYLSAHNISNLKSGYYLFTPSDSVSAIVKTLRQGGASAPLNNQDTVTVREGETIDDIATEVGEKTKFTKAEFLKAVNDKAFFNRLKSAYPGLLDSEASSKQVKDIRYRLEGYLYPATYNWKDSNNARELVNQMVAQSYTQLKGKFDAIKNAGLTVHETLTLASLVEREGIDQDSRRTIAGVFLNRIDKNMPLQSDIATKYALKTNKTNLSNKDVQSTNPYNLYKYSGYGPGPFNNPSAESIEAVLNPKDRDKNYLYFVANLKTGKVYYSATYDEHLGKSSDLEAGNTAVGNSADN
ncbi:endolytic transglycosylase MltG [Weissella paramesenteroides]|uniref:Endolytic murein transglycosylase n=1 Tax=Weissella paramesenteroides TaxID=1249 RepID=A0ABD4XI26_WEIPA|nr:endolytic transglycosylase MltG [Weissella paramesenteroides]MDF8368618.1 endolytic transglycosylase MltG [Weissella paramesenteroides]MDF8370610.1 endolytic transglycosylase MltG [Weissella paramesenteroides]